MRLIYLYILLFSAQLYADQAPWVGTDLNGDPCQGPDAWYGPWDFTKPEHKAKIPIVETHHFTENVENHVKGQEGSVRADLDYTLSTVPNHHKALLSIIRYQIKYNLKLIRNDKDHRLLKPVECYLKRAINFSKNDVASIQLYAYYLTQINQYQKAKEMYQMALKLDENNIKVLYSYGMLLLEMGEYGEAVEYAKKAYSLGNPPKTLRDRLTKKGYWKISDAPESVTAPSESTADQ